MTTSTLSQTPSRSLDQRMEALNRANHIRVRRAQLKRDLKAGRVRIGELIADPGLPERVLPELERLVRQHGAETIEDLVGIAHPRLSSSTRA